ncbi:MAG: 30S ribosomal protein S11 [Candidatus Moranbacteria bacterium]|jgi:small subunit ribosomal protein S11|nr:30S ribosomal protein S11 [Candidatus Moranbacteria bacterium]MDD5651824.1 30S ribosomal protein S11 [Candidatus Moranbacteria bacterium]MDX9855493.1 30S ribosomal protein S11 [Candidatus Moranbacteria bacterium]
MTGEKKIVKEDIKKEADSVKEAELLQVSSKASKSKRSIFKGQAHIQCTYNNTMITVSDMNGAVLGWSSAGLLGFKGAKKSTPYAATRVAADVSEKVKKYNLKELMIFIKGVGGGRESSIRGLAGAGFDISLIKDITPIPHNGCRRRKPRRV